tara:strand:+ start:1264 stop:1407 length:144 start_codon:yes stop_codon:yes gene_type:complete
MMASSSMAMTTIASTLLRMNLHEENAMSTALKAFGASLKEGGLSLMD